MARLPASLRYHSIQGSTSAQTSIMEPHHRQATLLSTMLLSANARCYMTKTVLLAVQAQTPTRPLIAHQVALCAPHHVEPVRCLC